MATLTDISGIGPAMANRLIAAGITTVDAVASAQPATLAQIQGLSPATAALLIGEAQKAAPARKAPAVAKAAKAKKLSSKKSSSKTSAADIKKLRAKIAKQNKRIKELEKAVATLKGSKKRKKK